MATDITVLELLVRWFQIAVSTEEGTVDGVSQDEAQQIVNLVEAGEAGFKLGLRGRELVNAAMHAVRFDEIGVEASTAIVQQMIDERTDTERLNLLESVVVDMEYMRRASRFRGEASVLGVEIHIAGHSQSRKAWGENLRVCLDALSGKFDDEPEA